MAVTDLPVKPGEKKTFRDPQGKAPTVRSDGSLRAAKGIIAALIFSALLWVGITLVYLVIAG